jgi:hypothetical protein
MTVLEPTGSIFEIQSLVTGKRPANQLQQSHPQESLQTLGRFGKGIQAHLAIMSFLWGWAVSKDTEDWKKLSSRRELRGNWLISSMTNFKVLFNLLRSLGEQLSEGIGDVRFPFEDWRLQQERPEW